MSSTVTPPVTAPSATPPTTPSTPPANKGGISRTTLGYLIQLGGIAAFTLGAIFSVHHIAIGASFLGGAAAFFVGDKIRTLS